MPQCPGLRLERGEAPGTRSCREDAGRAAGTRRGLREQAGSRGRRRSSLCRAALSPRFSQTPCGVLRIPPARSGKLENCRLGALPEREAGEAAAQARGRPSARQAGRTSRRGGVVKSNPAAAGKGLRFLLGKTEIPGFRVRGGGGCSEQPPLGQNQRTAAETAGPRPRPGEPSDPAATPGRNLKMTRPESHLL